MTNLPKQIHLKQLCTMVLKLCLIEIKKKYKNANTNLL